MNNNWKLISSSTILVMSSLLFAGCEQASKPYTQSPLETMAPTRQYPFSNNANEPVAAVGSLDSEPSASPDVNTDHEAHVSANESSNIDPNEKLPVPVTAKPAPKPKVEAKDAYQQEKPTLMGLKIGMEKDPVLNRFGKPKNQFVMDEDTDAVNVYEYTDFSIGFNKQNELEFVDIHTADIDPGLGGLRLGQKSEDAVAILGKPDTNTTFVLSYKAQGTILKLDMDPKTDTIQSIKLFSSLK